MPVKRYLAFAWAATVLGVMLGIVFLTFEAAISGSVLLSFTLMGLLIPFGIVQLSLWIDIVKTLRAKCLLLALLLPWPEIAIPVLAVVPSFYLAYVTIQYRRHAREKQWLEEQA